MPILCVLTDTLAPSLGAARQQPAGNMAMSAAAAYKVADSSPAPDVTAELQEAINAAANSTLILPRGRHVVTGLRLPVEGIQLVGVGATLVLNSDAPEGSSVLTIPRGAKDVSIRGLAIEGGAAGNMGRRINGIVSEGFSQRIHILGNKISGLPRNGIVLTNGDAEWEICHNQIENSGRFGIVVDFLTTPAKGIRIMDNSISGSAEGPISFVANRGGANDIASAGVWGAYISGNKTSLNGQGISGYSPYNQDVVVINNEIVGSGIHNVKGHAAHWGGHNIKIIHNKMLNTSLSAVMISAWPNGNPVPITSYEVRDNLIDGVSSLPGGTGILIQNASDGQIEGNTIRRFMENGIYATGDALGKSSARISHISVKHNLVEFDQQCAASANSRYGIALMNADDVEVVENIVRGECGKPIVIKK